MPASEVMNLYRQHKLHSGPGGPVVKKKKQAVAIQISMARKEGHHIPEVKGSFQKGGLVPETGDYRVHQGEEVQPLPPVRRNPVRVDDSGFQTQRPLPEITIHSAPTMHHNFPEHESLGHGLAPPPPQRRIEEPPAPPAQAQDIAARTRGAEEAAYQAAMHQRHAPGQGITVPGKNDPSYAVEGLKGSVAQRMHEQGERAAGIKASFQEGGTAQSTGDYALHQGEDVYHPTFKRRGSEAPDSVMGGSRPGGTGAGEMPPGMPENLKAGPATTGLNETSGGAASSPAAAIGSKLAAAYGIPTGAEGKLGSFMKGGGKMTQYNEAHSAVAAPLARSSSDFEIPGYKRGGTIPRTGIYRLHAGETVIPKSLASQYRKARHG